MKIGIIGAGILGLTLAYRFSQAGYDVHLFEKEDRAGGLSTWHCYGDFTWDKYYHVILQKDSALLSLIKELNIQSHLCWKQAPTGFLWKNTLVSLSNYKEFLQFPALNFLDKLRFGFGIVYSYFLQNPEKLKGVTAEIWLSRLFGKKTFTTFWLPLLHSKFGTLSNKVPAHLLLSTINRYYGTKTQGQGQDLMGYLRGGGQKVLISSLLKEIQSKDGKISYDEIALQIEENDNFACLKTDKDNYRFDYLISTLPSFLFDRLNGSIASKEKQAQPIGYLGVIRLALVLKESLSPYYITNLIDQGHPYTGIIEVSRLIDRKELSDHTLVMIPRYDIPSSEWFHFSDQEILSRFLKGLRATWPNIEQNILRAEVHREKIVQAIWESPPKAESESYEKKRILKINGELAGFDTLNNNAIIRLANEKSRYFLEAIHALK